RRRPVLQELPARWIILERGLEGDLRRIWRLQREREITERQRQAEPARLDVGLLQRPVVEEDLALLNVRQLAQVADLARREMTAGDIVREVTADMFDINADLTANRHRARDQAFGVRDVEAQVRDTVGPIEDF